MSIGAPATIPAWPTALLRVLQAERLKLRGTLALWMCLVAPGLVVAVVVLQLVFSEMRGPPRPPDEAWSRFAMGVMALWAFLMVPLFVTLEAALLAALEHGNRQWQRLLALPLPRSTHYVAKLLTLGFLLLLAQATLMLLIPLGGGVLMVFQPALGLAGAPPWELLARTGAAIFVASALVVSLHTWVALRWRSFAVACGLGMGATVMGFLIGQSVKFGPWYPWSLPVQMLANGGDKSTVMVFSAAGALLVALAGVWQFANRDHD